VVKSISPIRVYGDFGSRKLALDSLTINNLLELFSEKEQRMHDWYSMLDKYVIYPLYYKRVGDPRLAHWQQLEVQQFWSPSKLAALQLQKLQQMLNHAYSTVPFYKDLYDSAGISPRDLQSVQDIQYFPCVTKQDIQDQGDRLLSSKYDKADLVADASGGSTGKPTSFYKDKAQFRLRSADQIRHDRWSGWDLGDPYALVWGAQKDLTAIESRRQRFVTQYIHRIIPLDAFDLTEERIIHYINILEARQPPMILGYANALAQFAQFLAQQKPNHTIRPKGIISSAESLSPENKQLIEKVFQCKVLNRYGSREVGLVASECQQQTGLHINSDNILMEIGNFGADSTDNQSQRIPKLCAHEESGEIIVTDFWNFGMPFIRYRMGDEGHTLAKSCPCNRTLPLLGKVSGRVSDFIIASSGRKIHGEFFTHLFYHKPHVKQFQLIQHTLNQIDLKIVADTLNEMEQAALQAEIQAACGKDVQVNIIHCEKIPPAPSGKHMFTISKLKTL